MHRDEIFTMVINMIAFHRDLQHLPICNNLQPFIQRYFEVPESGILHNVGEYEINTKGVYVTSWNKKRTYRFSWKSILPHIEPIQSQIPFF